MLLRIGVSLIILLGIILLSQSEGWLGTVGKVLLVIIIIMVGMVVVEGGAEWLDKHGSQGTGPFMD